MLGDHLLDLEEQLVRERGHLNEAMTSLVAELSEAQKAITLTEEDVKQKQPYHRSRVAS